MTTVSLEWLAAPVIGLRPPEGQPSVIVGPSPNSPVGPTVAIGASVEGFALVAHLEPEVAIQLAAKIMEAAAAIAEGRA